MKKILFIIVCVIFVFVLFGCSNDPLIGVWKYTDAITDAMVAVGTDPNDIPEYAFEVKSPEKIIGNPEGGSVELTYKIDGDQVIIYDENGIAQEPLTLDGDNLKLADGTIVYTKK